MSGSPSGTITDLYSDLDLADPSEYYGGYKIARVTRFGIAERLLSDIWTGEWKGSTMAISLSDTDRLIRPQLVSPINKYWTLPIAVRMTDRVTRAALGRPKTVFVGTLVNAQPMRPLGWDLTLMDAIGQGILSDEFQIPFRQVRDGFLSLLDQVNQDLDQDSAEPVIYGSHVRNFSSAGSPLDPPSADGFVYTPMLLGKQTVAGTQYWVWLICGHAIADILDLYVDGSSVIGDEGMKWLVPHYAGFNGVFSAPYADFTSDTYGDTLRYTVIYGKVGETDPDACAAGTASLTVPLLGIEPNGDGSGVMIDDQFQQYKHFAINYLAHQGRASYRSGAWLPNPVWDLIDGPVEIVDEDSFDAATAIGQARLPKAGSPSDPAGYIGAAIIGANGERDTARRWLADWSRSSASRFGWTSRGRMRIVLLNPTVEIKATAQLFTDGYEILEGSFETAIKWAEQANAVPFKADFRYETGQWTTFGTATQDMSIANYGRTILAEAREYPFAPGITQSFHRARLESIIRQDPPRTVILASNVDNSQLGAKELGDYIKFRHYAAVGLPSQVRLGQIQRQAIDVGERKAYTEVIDCDSFLNYADPSIDLSPDPGNDVCGSAVDMSGETVPYVIVIDTSGRSTDGSATGFCGSGVAYNPAWWMFHGIDAMSGAVSTAGSLYDTVLSVWRVPTGDSCASKELILCNDDQIDLYKTSYLDLPFLDPFYDYYFLASGNSASDSGQLQFTFFAEVI